LRKENVLALDLRTLEYPLSLSFFLSRTHARMHARTHNYLKYEKQYYSTENKL